MLTEQDRDEVRLLVRNELARLALENMEERGPLLTDTITEPQSCRAPENTEYNLPATVSLLDKA